MAFGKADAVKVNGLADFRRELKTIDAELPKELRKTNLAAAELVAKDARTKANNQGGVARHVEPSIIAAATQGNAKLAWGGSKFPMAAGAEFGSIRFKQFKPWRGSGSDAGYFMFPAVRETREQFIEVYDEMLADLTRHAFPIGG